MCRQLLFEENRMWSQNALTKEYAIEIYEENEEGDFVNGSDFETQDEMEILD